LRGPRRSIANCISLSAASFAPPADSSKRSRSAASSWRPSSSPGKSPSCSTRTNSSQSARRIPSPCVAYEWNSREISLDCTLRRSSSMVTCTALQLSLPSAATSSASRDASRCASSSGSRTAKLARRRSVRRSARRRYPVVPRSAAPAMHASAHRACGGETRRGRAARSASRPLSHTRALASAMCSSRRRGTPPLPVKCRWSAAVLWRRVAEGLRGRVSSDCDSCLVWRSARSTRHTWCTVHRLRRRSCDQRRLKARRSACTKTWVRGKTCTILRSASVPVARGRRCSGVSGGSFQPRVERNWRIAARASGLTRGTSRRSQRTSFALRSCSLRCSTRLRMTCGGSECARATSKMCGTCPSIQN